MSGPSVLVDTNIFLSARNPGEEGHAACRALLDRIDRGDLRAMVSAITLAEVRAGLTPPEARVIWQAFASHLLMSPNYRVEPVDAPIAEIAGEVRSRTKLTLPDALIVATGHVRGAACVITQDRELGRLQTLLRARSPREMA